jgi:hypothetical protein
MLYADLGYVAIIRSHEKPEQGRITVPLEIAEMQGGFFTPRQASATGFKAKMRAPHVQSSS